jgi:putative MATE family efflux protein
MRNHQSQTPLATTAVDQRPLPSIWAIAAPVFIELLLTFSVFFSDSFFLSRMSDEVAASVGAVIPLFMICVLIFTMMAQGASNVASQFLGARQAQGVARVYCAALVINSALGLGAAVAMGFCAHSMAAVLGLDEIAQAHAADFMIYIAPALVLISIKCALACVFVSQGKTLWNLLGGVLAIVVNIVCNVLFHEFRMGIFGVALATLFSQLAVIGLYGAVAPRAMRVRYDWADFWRNRRACVQSVLRTGMPSVIQPVSSELAMLVLAAAAVRLGVEALAARVYVMNLATLAICWAAAISIGNQVLVSILAGARQPQAADETLHKNLKIALAGSVLIAIALRLFGEQLLGLFTTDPKIIGLGVQLLTITILLEAARAFGTLSGFALKAAGDANFSAVVGVAVTWLVAVPLGVYLCLYAGVGMAGLWIGLAVDEGLRGVINYLRWKSGLWQGKSVGSLM